MVKVLICLNGLEANYDTLAFIDFQQTHAFVGFQPTNYSPKKY